MGYTTSIRSKRQRIVTALDIGTSKICCLIAKTSPAPDWFEGKGDAMQFEVLGFDHTRAEGLKAGGRDNGGAGPRADYSPTYYAAFLIDPDGNNVEAVCT